MTYSGWATDPGDDGELVLIYVLIYVHDIILSNFGSDNKDAGFNLDELSEGIPLYADSDTSL